MSRESQPTDDHAGPAGAPPGAPAEGRPSEPVNDAEMGIYTGAMTPELQAYYADRRLMWRNIGWGLVFAIINPLMILRLNSKEVGMGEGLIATIMSINSYLVCSGSVRGSSNVT